MRVVGELRQPLESVRDGQGNGMQCRNGYDESRFLTPQLTTLNHRALHLHPAPELMANGNGEMEMYHMDAMVRWYGPTKIT